ncbi:IclR family transcriptional regulator [Microbacterium halophytorum]|uniref:IclR family transcriptional regulator n=1 Tax=Microbacterium halophytorum TaxID=2067568 RepID=UPI000CFBC128|nr:IclR family transcriptional regulator [Microbacterium halophytorum]
MSNDNSGGSLEILDKADAVLRHLAAEGESSAIAIAEGVGEPTSSTYRILSNLQLLGWVESGVRRGAYRLGLDFLRVGSIVEDRLNVREAAVPELRELLATTGATSYLCIRADDRAVCVERFEGADVRSLALRLGQSLELHHGAAPRAILAHLPDAERAALVERFVGDTGGGAPSRAELEAVIDATRAQGFALSDGDVTHGIAAVGAPIFNHRGEVEGALSVSGLRGKLLAPELRAAELVSEAAARASAALGYQAGGE